MFEYNGDVCILLSNAFGKPITKWVFNGFNSDPNYQYIKLKRHSINKGIIFGKNLSDPELINGNAKVKLVEKVNLQIYNRFYFNNSGDLLIKIHDKINGESFLYLSGVWSDGVTKGGYNTNNVQSLELLKSSKSPTIFAKDFINPIWYFPCLDYKKEATTQKEPEKEKLLLTYEGCA